MASGWTRLSLAFGPLGPYPSPPRGGETTTLSPGYLLRLCAVDNRIQSLWGDGLPDEMMLRTDGHEIRDAICLLVVKLPVGLDEEFPWNQMGRVKLVNEADEF